MAYSFNAVAFGPATPDGFVPRPVRTLIYSIEHIPYSDRDVIDRGGLSYPQYRATIIVLAANVAAFEALLGVQGTLVWDGTSMTAVLLELLNPRWNFDRTHIWYDAMWTKIGQ